MTTKDDGGLTFPDWTSPACHYCGLKHPSVEAGGMWHCPNNLCTGPGAAYYRSSLPSFKETGKGRHTVDSAEWCRKALADLVECDDPKVRAATFASFEEYMLAERARREGTT